MCHLLQNPRFELTETEKIPLHNLACVTMTYIIFFFIGKNNAIILTKRGRTGNLHIIQEVYWRILGLYKKEELHKKPITPKAILENVQKNSN